ncbi:succinylglutamate desuccinylase/aspartoacylase family protein [Chitinophaga solisilvae]|uniref:succinylglutamate desuccinylase/aspartoacylase family protein n=1 Tax=Chitinophaga solisilvae TaxID=1233460 RepID=UPI00136AD908|nr:M14 family metallopeptidase [Chitinophaga solisilvae]
MKYPGLIFICLLAIQPALARVKDFVFSGHAVKPGTRASFEVKLPNPDGDSALLPFTVIHGRKAGPVLGLIAGIHGYEYPPIMTLQALPAHIDPQELTGTLLILHIANVAAFSGRSVYLNPADKKNLNRSFPGNAGGSITERIAHFIATTVFSRCNYIIDNHGGDASEDLHGYAGYYRYGSQTAVSGEMAAATGFDWITPADIKPGPGEHSMYCNREAAMQNIPAITIEYGKLGNVSQEDIRVYTTALLRVIRYLRMLPGTPPPANQPMYINTRASIKSNHTGIIHTTMKSGELVRKGMKLGFITGFTGQHLEDIISPVDGVIIYLLATPPVNKGETLFSFGVLPGP